MLSKRWGLLAYNYFYCYNFSFLYLFAPARSPFYIVYLCSFFVSRDRSWVLFLLSFVLLFVSSVLACVFSWAWVGEGLLLLTLLFFFPLGFSQVSLGSSSICKFRLAVERVCCSEILFSFLCSIFLHDSVKRFLWAGVVCGRHLE
jgi:hypothetical protein